MEVPLLFEDFMFRFQRSNRLDSGQKDVYSRRVTDFRNRTSKPKRQETGVITQHYAHILDDLLAATHSVDGEKLTALISELDKQQIYSRERESMFRVFNARHRMAKEYAI